MTTLWPKHCVHWQLRGQWILCWVRGVFFLLRPLIHNEKANMDELGKYVSGESDLALDRMQSVSWFDGEPGESRNVVMWSLQGVGEGHLPIQ